MLSKNRTWGWERENNDATQTIFIFRWKIIEKNWFFLIFLCSDDANWVRENSMEISASVGDFFATKSIDSTWVTNEWKRGSHWGDFNANFYDTSEIRCGQMITFQFRATFSSNIREKIIITKPFEKVEQPQNRNFQFSISTRVLKFTCNKNFITQRAARNLMFNNIVLM